jgi:hypothetical protein
MLAGLREDPDCYGILRPKRGSALHLKAVSNDTALLLLALGEPSQLEPATLRAMGEQCEDMVAQMVLDGILEIEVDGRMLSGPLACEWLFVRNDRIPSEGSLAALSRSALEYAEALCIDDARVLSSRLYAYNSVPESSRWRSLLSDERGMEKFLGIRVPAAAAAAPWLSWRSAHAAPQPGTVQTCKLYISPTPAELPNVFPVALETLSQSASHCWKVGTGVHGILRPDKLVAYFESLQDLQTTAAQLLVTLRSCPAQGVPFTAALAESRLLSWGIDPPPEEPSVPWLQRESWRTRICNRLGAALAMAKNAPDAGISPSVFARERLRLEGIDTETWAPWR